MQTCLRFRINALFGSLGTFWHISHTLLGWNVTCYFPQFLDLHVICQLLAYAGCVRACMCARRRWRCRQLEKESGKGAISEQLGLIASTLFWWAAAHCEMAKCCIVGLLSTATRLRDIKHVFCCHRASPQLTVLISAPCFTSAVAHAHYLPDPISLPLCFAPDVSAFSLNSTSGSLFFPRCLFHLLVTSLTQSFSAPSHEACFLYFLLNLFHDCFFPHGSVLNSDSRHWKLVFLTCISIFNISILVAAKIMGAVTTC